MMRNSLGIEVLDKSGSAVSAAQAKKVAIVGLPNTYKSQIFNSLTGEYAIVANYAGTTVEMKRAKTCINRLVYEVIDTPGLHCLSIHSEEEIVVRNMILDEKPDIIIQCIDANQLGQSLLLTADLLDLEIPMMVVLSAVDEALQKGIEVNSKALARSLGVPVVESNPLRGQGLGDLKKALISARKGNSPAHGYGIESAIVEVAALLPFEQKFKHMISSLLLLKDVYLEKYLAEKFGEKAVSLLLSEINTLRRKFKSNIENLIIDERALWVDKMAASVVRKRNVKSRGFADHFAYACRDPLMGIPILMALVSMVYLGVTYGSGLLDKILNVLLVKPTTSFITSLALPVFWNDFLIGTYGILTLGFFNAICTVLPILTVFFFIFGAFEDSGYITNFCVFSKRLFEKIGVTGKAIIPLVLGFGCKSMATLSTKGLTSYKEKFIATYLIAFAVPCSAQLGISIAILSRVGLSAALIAFGTLAILELLAGLILNTAITEKVDDCFIQVLAPMRLPDLKAVWTKTSYRIVMFLKEAIPIFIVSAVMLFVIDKIGLLDLTKRVLSPLIVSWMGLPRDATDVFLLALARREAAAGLILKMVEAGHLNYIQSIVAVVVTTILFPCFTNVISIVKEMGMKSAAVMISLISVSSFVLVGGLRWILVLTCSH